MLQCDLLLREALEVHRETLGNRHPSTLIAINKLASLLREKGDLAAAKLLYLEVVKAQRQTLGVHHRDTRVSNNRLALLRQQQRNLDHLAARATQVQMKDDAASYPLAAFLAEFDLI